MRYLRQTIIAGASLLPALALAQTPNDSYITNIGDLLGTLIPILMTIALVVFFWGLVRYLFAAGDPEKASTSKHLMIWGVVALFIMTAVWGLTRIIGTTLGINSSNSQAPSTSNLIPNPY